MPFDQVMSKFKGGALHSGSKAGPAVTNRKQAIAIMMSEKRAAGKGKKEYQSKKKKKKPGIAVTPSNKIMSKYGMNDANTADD